MITKTSKVRLTLIFIFFCVTFCIMAIHLYLLQITRSSFFSHLGEQQYRLTVTRSPARGSLYDVHNKLIATEKSVISLFITPSSLKNKNELITFLTAHYPDALKKLEEHPHAYFMYVARNIPEADGRVTQLPEDLYILEEPGRLYPYKSLCSVVGRTDIDNQGVSGIELLYNKELTGIPTTFFVEKDARSGRYYFNKKMVNQGALGTSLHLTLDSTLHFLVSEEVKETIEKYGAREGAAVIMDPVTGAIYAMVSLPDCDPSERINDMSLLKNKVVTETYELGSVMKTFLALAALEENIFKPGDIIDCENKKVAYVNGMKLSTWKEHGLLTFSEVIEFSNNIGTSKIAQKLGTKLYTHYQRCGFGMPTGFDFPGQQKGYVTHPKTWSKASLNSLSFGYESRATLLQLARALSLFTNGGYLPTPYLVQEHKKEPDTTPLYRPETIQEMRAILKKTCTQGTAHAAVIPGVTVLGKTGTARLLDDQGLYSPLKNIYTFSGIVEKGTYKRVIVTFIKEAARHDVYASTVAAPLFERIAQKMLIHDKVL